MQERGRAAAQRFDPIGASVGLRSAFDRLVRVFHSLSPTSPSLPVYLPPCLSLIYFRLGGVENRDYHVGGSICQRVKVRPGVPLFLSVWLSPFFLSLGLLFICLSGRFRPHHDQQIGLTDKVVLPL